MILGTGLMMLPLLLLGVLGYGLYLQTIHSFESVMQHNRQVLLPVSDLQRRILKIDRPLDQYLYSTSPRERAEFERQSQDIVDRFGKLLGHPQLLAMYHDEISRALQSWKQARALGAIIMQRHAAAEGVSLQMLVRFEELQQEATDILGRMYRIFDSEIQRSYQDALRDQRQIQFMLLLVFIVGVLSAVSVGNYLARRVLKPLEILRQGAERFGRGDLSYRIELDSPDEFGRMGKTFNTMADQLEYLAAYDGLTGLLNKREFDMRLEDEIRRSRRTRNPFVLLMLDLDHFKRVNDTYGHKAGDRVLQEFAKLLKQQVREVDYIGRYGGEEFSIILTDTSETGGRDSAERIRENIESAKLTVNETTSIQATVSIGLASYPDDASSSDELFNCADDALYRAKKSGRNRMISFSDS